ncbi:DUF7524 family protein [Natronolimnobius baerhuensis]|uniref:Uncharacterized protein n=1 Tax=Natronolimnobius baerhuensis TaxID=253108 RepID=A0A202E928_9EURY|nr:hypothetical protein [Natronolimnobius baerhuensis]OVE84786.1 hypothetical protein B2G88_10430 [Natronolimnobius baerhuensis]
MPVSRTEVTVHVNREATDTLETDMPALEARGSFALHLQGHDTPAHVHCRLNGDRRFSQIVSIDGPNYYVEANDMITVPISVAATDIDGSLEGELEVLTGYGSESVTIDVTVKPKPATVDIDESFSKPRAETTTEQSPLEQALERASAVGLEPGTLALAALGVLALGIGVSTAATIGGPAAMIALLVVVGGVTTALALVLS